MMASQNISHHTHLGMWNLRSTRAACLIGAIGTVIIITALVLVILHNFHVSMDGLLNKMTQNYYIGGLTGAHIILTAGGIIGIENLGFLIFNKIKTVKLIKALENKKNDLEAETISQGRTGRPSPLELNNTKVWVGYDNGQETCEIHYFYKYKQLKKFMNTPSE